MSYMNTKDIKREKERQLARMKAKLYITPTQKENFSDKELIKYADAVYFETISFENYINDVVIPTQKAHLEKENRKKEKCDFSLDCSDYDLMIRNSKFKNKDVKTLFVSYTFFGLNCPQIIAMLNKLKIHQKQFDHLISELKKVKEANKKGNKITLDISATIALKSLYYFVFTSNYFSIDMLPGILTYIKMEAEHNNLFDKVFDANKKNKPASKIKILF